MNHRICPTLSTSVLLLAVFAPAAMAATYTCPAPQSINCVPATSTINGWKANGGQMTGNSFTVVGLAVTRNRCFSPVFQL